MEKILLLPSFEDEEPRLGEIGGLGIETWIYLMLEPMLAATKPLLLIFFCSSNKHHNLSDLKQYKFSSYHSKGQKSNVEYHWVEIKFSAGVCSFRRLYGRIYSFALFGFENQATFVGSWFLSIFKVSSTAFSTGFLQLPHLRMLVIILSTPS